jgi:uncharacterized SAM-dependent methyltransferase
VTAAFNLNLARRINRELGGTIPLDSCATSRAGTTPTRGSRCISKRSTTSLRRRRRRFALARGETIHTENCHKFDRRSQYTLLTAGGWTPLERWVDTGERFSLILAEATRPRNAP